MNVNNELREKLADYAHRAWAGWMEYMFTKGIQSAGGFWLPMLSYDRWTRQKNTAYADLPEAEKTSDRKEADTILDIISGEIRDHAALRAKLDKAREELRRIAGAPLGASKLMQDIARRALAEIGEKA